MPYNHTESEQSVNQFWKDNNTFATPKINIGDKKKYILDAFAYPSGKGIHAGHAEGYIATDILARYYRQTGYKVLFPVGFDSFGLPAENYAIKTGVHPRTNTDETIRYYREQISAIGLSNDWADEFGTHNEDYYKWTQWFFSLLYQRGLAYKKEALVNWDPVDQTVLANEQVLADGTAERSGAMVEQKMMSQWFFKITDYADRLLTDLDKINWPSSTKLMQKNWIGKSIGAEVAFEIANNSSNNRFGDFNYIFLHGWEGSSETNFLPEIRKLFESKGLDVQIPNLPNSSNPNIDQQADYVIANCHIDSRTVIVGHSLGVAVGLKVLEKWDNTMYNLDDPTGKAPEIDYCAQIAKFISIAGFVSNEFRQDNLPQGVTDPFDISQANFNFELIKSKCQEFKGIWSDDDQFITAEQTKVLEQKLDCQITRTTGGKHLNNLSQKAIQDIIFDRITVFTTRIDTIYSGTFLILAPEHKLVASLTTDEQLQEVEAYQTLTKAKSQFERTEMNKDKSGVWTGSYAINPANGNKIQIWISDFVIASYGSGAVFADAHDERDFEMAKKFDIPLITSIIPPQDDDNYRFEVKNLQECYSGYGTLYNSGQFDGLESKEAIPKIIEFGESQGWAKAKVTYRLRDWLVSRQRYWGSPIPIIYKDGQETLVPHSDLPVILPDDVEFKPTGRSPLIDHADFHTSAEKLYGAGTVREVDTMDTFACSLARTV